MYRYCKSLLTVTLMSVLTLSAGYAIADKKNLYQDHESIRQAAKSYAAKLTAASDKGQTTSIEVGTLDSRLRLARCSKPLEAFDSPNTRNHGRTTVGVKCNGEKSWKLYIPVNIQVTKSVVTIKNSVTKNSILQASNLVLADRDISTLHRGYFTSRQELVGKHVTNNIKAGTVLLPVHVKNPLAVKKGSMVMIVADAGGVRVNMKGKAMKSGSLGDWIPVQNLSSKRQIEGRILRPGVILVTL
jgi:flagella basal body P-ring formation protein FlgA